MSPEEASNILRIKIPTTDNVLKRAYRKRSFEEHPDHSQSKDADERFREVSKAYETLKDSSMIELSGERAREMRCVDGTPLSSLGQGLDFTQNGAPCENCEGKGYRTIEHHGFAECDNCRMQPGILVVWEYCCPRCEGSGEFKLKSGKVKGECFRCKGHGWIAGRTPWNNCRLCHGTRIKPDEKRLLKQDHYVCGKCKGKGETPIFNPVIPKGLLNISSS